MPFTYFHLGPALLIGLVAYRYLDFPTFVAANVMVDFKATLVFFGLIGGPLHSFFHSFLGATVLASLLTGVMILLREHRFFSEVMKAFFRPQTVSKGKISAAAFLGGFIHVFLDSIIYSDMQAFWPIETGFLPVPGLQNIVYLFCMACFLVAVPVYFWRVKPLK
ncbi:MAG: metal-dependent hydrolase [Candidatus Nanohalobium sp.]